MRLLDTSTGRFFRIFTSPPEPYKYAILSHVWATLGEPGFPEKTYNDILDIQPLSTDTSIFPSLPGHEKIRRFCEIAKADGYKYAWVDTCCIDKSNNTELSESIISMFSWYKQAAMCYAFLHDVNGPIDPNGPPINITGSKWFTRAWTLQELIAPKEVTFLSSNWLPIGNKSSLLHQIEAVTGIDTEVLLGNCPLDSISVARRLSWSASRQATKEEDETYALMGLFGVAMPVIYGERSGAFLRLQEEVCKVAPIDPTIFAWGSILPSCHFPRTPICKNPYTLYPPSSNIRSNSLLPNGLGRLSSLHPASDYTTRLSVDVDPSISYTEGLEDYQHALAPSPKMFLNWKMFLNRNWKSLSPPKYQEFVYDANENLVHIRKDIPIAQIQFSVDLPLNPTHIALLPLIDENGGRLALLLRKPDLSSGLHYFRVGGTVFDTTPPQHDPYRLTHFTLNQCARLLYLAKEEVAKSFRRSVFQTSSSISIQALPCMRWSPHLALIRRSDGTTGSWEHIPPEYLWSAPLQIHFQVYLSSSTIKHLSKIGWSISSPSDSTFDVGLGEHFLSQYHSSAGVTISKGHELSLKILIGRCNCDFGRRDGTLGVLVLSLNTEGADIWRRFIPEQHSVMHPIHARSWSRSRRVDDELTKTITFTSRKDSKYTFQLRLSLSASSSSPDRTYTFGVDPV